MGVELLHGDVTEKIIEGFYEVYNKLGYGFLEKVYENAMAIALARRGMQVAQQLPIKVKYDGIVVGDYFADLMVNGVVLVELKVAEELHQRHEAQLLNYLRATDVRVGLVLNFGPRPEFARKIV